MPPTTPPMTFLFESLKPSLLSVFFCVAGAMVASASPVVTATDSTPETVDSATSPLGSVVRETVVNGLGEKVTRGVLMVMGVVRDGSGSTKLD